jgi:cytoskeletal protein RodZ
MRGSFWFLFGMAVLFMVGVVWLLGSFGVHSMTEPTEAAVPESSAQPRSVQLPTGQAANATPGQSTARGGRKMLELPQYLLKSPGILTEDFESAAEWVKVSGAAAQLDKVNVKSGQAGLKLTGGTAKSAAEKKVNWDLSGSECMRLWVYRAKRSTNSFEIWLATKTNFSQYYRKEVTPNPIGWTLVQICQEEFSGVRGGGLERPDSKNPAAGEPQ